MTDQGLDVIIIGAGLSGIGAAYHLQRDCPSRRYVILEGREAIGGTWDLFRYPGIRSDSDMFTLGFNFKPWKEQKAIADGPSILSYVRETAAENGIDKHIRFRHMVKRLSWSSAEQLWSVEAEHQGQTVILKAPFIYTAAGYYKYDHGYTPDWPGMSSYQGRMIHPQHWPQDLDYTGKSVLVIGSGATAVTLVPAMTDKAQHVTMLQRSPTYMVSRPAEDAQANWLRRNLPSMLAYQLVRWRNVLLQSYFFNLVRRYPARAKERLINELKPLLPANYDIATHLTPKYNPWDQRLCLVPDADMFKAISSGKASIVTDQIESFTETGVKLKSGAEIKADIIVTATGLDLTTLGGADVVVDGKAVRWPDTLIYKGMMYSDVPNLVNAFGYTNASWTLKADLTSEYFCRMLNYLDREGYAQFTPRTHGEAIETAPFVDFSSGYFQRALERLPKQGAKAPWRLYQNYFVDLLNLRFGSLNTKEMEFKRRLAARRASNVVPIRDAAE